MSIFDQIEAFEERKQIRLILREEEEARLSETYLSSLKPHHIASAIESALGGMVDRKVFIQVIDKASIDEKIYEFINFIADELAHQQAIINEQFRDEDLKNVDDI